MKRLLERFWPHHRRQTFWQAIGQIFAMGYFAVIIGIIAVFITPLFVLPLAYYIGESAIRGSTNRWNMFTAREQSEVKDEWWDAWIHVSLWAISGCLMGVALHDNASLIILIIAGTILGLFLESVYQIADKAILKPPSTYPAVRPAVTNSQYNPNYNNNYVYKEKPRLPWCWVGFQPEGGPKEDVLFPVD